MRTGAPTLVVPAMGHGDGRAGRRRPLRAAYCQNARCGDTETVALLVAALLRLAAASTTPINSDVVVLDHG